MELRELCHEFFISELQQATNNFAAERVIGEGTSGRVYQGSLQNGTQVAIKLLQNSSSSSAAASSSSSAAASSSSSHSGFEQEVRLLSKFRHPNLVTLVGFASHQEHTFLVYELLPGGDLRKKLCNSVEAWGGIYPPSTYGAGIWQNHQNKTTKSTEEDLRRLSFLTTPPNTTTTTTTFPMDLHHHSPFIFSWQERLNVALDSICGLSHLHSCRPKIFHRDIKATNILLDHNGNAKLADFGLASAAISHNRPYAVFDAVRGTPGYVDPRYILHRFVDESAEVYSFGMVLLELLTALPPAIFITEESPSQTAADHVTMAGLFSHSSSPTTETEATVGHHIAASQGGPSTKNGFVPPPSAHVGSPDGPPPVAINNATPMTLITKENKIIHSPDTSSRRANQSWATDDNPVLPSVESCVSGAGCGNRTNDTISQNAAPQPDDLAQDNSPSSHDGLNQSRTDITVQHSRPTDYLLHHLNVSDFASVLRFVDKSASFPIEVTRYLADIIRRCVSPDITHRPTSLSLVIALRHLISRSHAESQRPCQASTRLVHCAQQIPSAYGHSQLAVGGERMMRFKNVFGLEFPPPSLRHPQIFPVHHLPHQPSHLELSQNVGEDSRQLSPGPLFSSPYNIMRPSTGPDHRTTLVTRNVPADNSMTVVPSVEGCEPCYENISQRLSGHVGVLPCSSGRTMHQYTHGSPMHYRNTARVIPSVPEFLPHQSMPFAPTLDVPKCERNSSSPPQSSAVLATALATPLNFLHSIVTSFQDDVSTPSSSTSSTQDYREVATHVSNSESYISPGAYFQGSGANLVSRNNQLIPSSSYAVMDTNSSEREVQGYRQLGSVGPSQGMPSYHQPYKVPPSWSLPANGRTTLTAMPGPYLPILLSRPPVCATVHGENQMRWASSEIGYPVNRDPQHRDQQNWPADTTCLSSASPCGFSVLDHPPRRQTAIGKEQCVWRA